MKPLDQRWNECSLASICTFNDLSQKDYEAISDLAKEAGADYAKDHSSIFKAIETGANICRALGLCVPAGYPQKLLTPWLRNTDDTASSRYDFSGRGIVRVLFKGYRKRRFSSHVIAFEDGVLYNSDGIAYQGWEAYVRFLKTLKCREIEVLRIFR